MLTIEIPDDPTTIIYEKPRPREDGRHGYVIGEYELNDERHFIPAIAGACTWKPTKIDKRPAYRKVKDCGKKEECPACRRGPADGFNIGDAIGTSTLSNIDARQIQIVDHR